MPIRRLGRCPRTAAAVILSVRGVPSRSIRQGIKYVPREETGALYVALRQKETAFVDTNNPDTAFRFDPSAQQWIFNISTKNLTAGSTYVFTITLNDGTTIVFQFGLK
jgi:hypothetical protein